MEQPTLYKFPPEIRLKIFEYALEEFKSTNRRHRPTYAALLCDYVPPSRVNAEGRLRLQKTGLLAGFACSRGLYKEALWVYYEKTTFKLTLRNWRLLTSRDGVATKAIQCIQHLQIELFDGRILPSEVPRCFQYPWTVLFAHIPHEFLRLIMSHRSRLSKATRLQTLEIHAEGVKDASVVINDVVDLFLRFSPRLQRVIAKFPLYNHRSEQIAIMKQMIDYLNDPGYDDAKDDNEDNKIKFRTPPVTTVHVLNAKLGKASCVTWKGPMANLKGTAVWQATKGRVLTQSKPLQRIEGDHRHGMEEVLLSIKRDMADNMVAQAKLSVQRDMLRILARVPLRTWSSLSQKQKDDFEASVKATAQN